jgi:hypothetical protein
VLDAARPVLEELSHLVCGESGDDAVVSWTRPQVYDLIEVRANGETVAALSGSADGWQGRLSRGLHDVSVHGFVGFDETRLGPCPIVLGYGQVLRSVQVDTEIDASSRARGDIASDGDGTLVVCGGTERRLYFFSLDLEPLGSAPISESFASDSDRLTGIAGAGRPEVVFIHNASRNTIGLVAFSGDLLRELPFRPDEDVTEFVGMTFHGDGATGEGRLWLAERYYNVLYEVDTASGGVLRRVHHPYGSIDGGETECAGAFTTGIAAVDGATTIELYLGGRTVSERWPQSFFRFDVDQEQILGGSEIPSRHLRDSGGAVFPAIEYVVTPTGPRLYVLNRYESRIYELDAALPEVRPPTFLTCEQIDRRDRIGLAFENNGPYDRIEVYRDRELVATLDGAASVFTDEGAAPGIREYAVRGVVGASASDFARCTVRVGMGAILQETAVCAQRNKSPTQITRDPRDGSFFVSDRPLSYLPRGTIQHFDADFRFLETIETEVLWPSGIEALALRLGPGDEPILYYLVVEIGNRDSELFLVEHRLGPSAPPPSSLRLDPPRRPGVFIQPAGLLWDAETDTFYYQQRTTDTIVQIDSEGETIRTFANPALPLAFQVQDEGLALHPRRRTLFVTTAGPGEIQVTKAVELRLDGTLTGFEVPLPVGQYASNDVVGITFAGEDLVAVALLRRNVLLRLKVFGEGGPGPNFRRGDANADGRADISDAVHTLAYLFLGGLRPLCFDAADADDSGDLDITDAVRLLGYLYLGERSPPPPGPDACGADPTEEIPREDFGCEYPIDACR